MSAPLSPLGLARLTAFGCSATAPEDRPEPHPAPRRLDLTWHPASHSALTVLDCSLRSRRIALWNRLLRRRSQTIKRIRSLLSTAVRDPQSETVGQ
jgi:hypothetical protein